MFNKNHLGHSFVDLDLDRDYNGVSLICEICEIKVFYYHPRKYEKYKHWDDFPGNYTVRTVNKNYNDAELITCDEVVIKNIIE